MDDETHGKTHGLFARTARETKREVNAKKLLLCSYVIKESEISQIN
jgi:hypothetical protein